MLSVFNEIKVEGNSWIRPRTQVRLAVLPSIAVIKCALHGTGEAAKTTAAGWRVAVAQTVPEAVL